VRQRAPGLLLSTRASSIEVIGKPTKLPRCQGAQAKLGPEKNPGTCIEACKPKRLPAGPGSDSRQAEPGPVDSARLRFGSGGWFRAAGGTGLARALAAGGSTCPRPATNDQSSSKTTGWLRGQPRPEPQGRLELAASRR